MEFVNWVYDTLEGQMVEGYGVPGVENAYAEGSYCADCYNEMRDAYDRLCDRLGVIDEDEDLDAIVRNLEHIQKEMCRKMYHYGTIFGNKTPG